MDRREMNRSIFQDTERMCKTDAELSAVTKISVAIDKQGTLVRRLICIIMKWKK